MYTCTTNVQQPSQASTAPQLASMHMIGQHRIESYTTPVPYRKQSDIKSFSRQHYISQLYYRFTIWQCCLPFYKLKNLL